MSVFVFIGENVYEYLKFESGVHRVQRVPVNDSKIQTSAASVVVMPEPTEVEVNIRQQDLKIDLYRSQGAGGDSPFTYEIKFAIILINSAADS